MNQKYTNWTLCILLLLSLTIRLHMAVAYLFFLHRYSIDSVGVFWCSGIHISMCLIHKLIIIIKRRRKKFPHFSYCCQVVSLLRECVDNARDKCAFLTNENLLKENRQQPNVEIRCEHSELNGKLQWKYSSVAAPLEPNTCSAHILQLQQTVFFFVCFS